QQIQNPPGTPIAFQSLKVRRYITKKADIMSIAKVKIFHLKILILVLMNFGLIWLHAVNTCPVLLCILYGNTTDRITMRSIMQVGETIWINYSNCRPAILL